MAGIFRAAIFAAASLAAGSWVGLGRPTADQARALLEARWSRVASDALGGASGAPPAPAAPAEDAGPRRADLELPPLPQAEDPRLVPSFTDWPRLNPEASIERAWMVAEGPRHAPDQGRRLVTLTFDDGPSSEHTPAVLRLLARHRIKATFFVIGRYLDGKSKRAHRNRDVLRRVAAAGHLVGNHTHDHALLTSATRADVLAQIDDGAASIERVLGRRPVLFRPPYGGLDEFGQSAVRERGLDLILWSVEKQDMQRDDAHETFREIVAQLDYKEGGVVLLHDVRKSSVEVLEKLLDYLDGHRFDPRHPTRMGYEVVDLPTYLRAVAADPLPYATRDELERARLNRR